MVLFDFVIFTSLFRFRQPPCRGNGPMGLKAPMTRTISKIRKREANQEPTNLISTVIIHFTSAYVLINLQP